MKGLAEVFEVGGGMLFVAVLVAFVCFVSSGILMIAWNAVMPELLGVRSITLGQSFAFQCVMGAIGSAMRGRR